MGWSNPPRPWHELERRLSMVPSGDGGDSPAWSHKREIYVAPPELSVERPQQQGRPITPYAELHCHSNFSFLDGASHPEELVEEAARLGLEALALTDHDGLAGIVRFAEAAAAVGLPTVFGSELSFGLSGPQSGAADPEGHHLLVLARDLAGYARLSRTISRAQLRGKQKGRPVYDHEVVAAEAAGHWAVLTGCRKGAVASALAKGGTSAASIELQALVEAFGAEHVYVELWHHGEPLDSDRNDALAEIAAQCSVTTIATNNVHYATPKRRRLATALAAVRARRSLDELQGWLPGAGAAYLRSGAEQATRFARWPGAIERAAELGRSCAFDLRLVAPRLPDFPVPAGHDEMSFLRQLVNEGATERYGPRSSRSAAVQKAWRQLEHELEVIRALDFPGYFLVVWDLVEFCRRSDILCQGRGSAANSAVCYALRITNVDAVAHGLLFERFLAPDREGAPDIDIDIESDRREEVIQYVYDRHGRERTAQVANVITYRARSAVRDMAKALGHGPGRQDAWSKQLERWGSISEAQDHDIPAPVLELAEEVLGFPRHLGIHSGGMVICKKPVVEVCPVEWGRMPGRTVLQWDKDDCAAIGLMKFDLLGLGMLSVIHYAIDLVRQHHGIEVDLAHLPQEDAVYKMLTEADSIGVFQVESRAQIATLPRLRPRIFYDLVCEVALIRPGPIQGNAVHPFIRRRNNREPVTYLHPLLKPALERTLGVPLFQEQLMHMAIDVAGFDAGEADALRRAVSSKRSAERMVELRARLYAGMAANGITGATADAIYEAMAAFANFGFAESHAISFALLVYASAYLKHHWPAAYLAALLRAQPMGFWAPHSLVADARRHGVVVLGPDVNASEAVASLEADTAVRVGISSVRTIDDALAARMAAGRPYTNAEDLRRRCELTLPQLEALATAGALDGFGDHRRQALWSAGAVVQSRPDRLPGIVVGADAPDLPIMSDLEETAADLWATGFSPNRSPVQFARAGLKKRGVVTAAGLEHCRPRSRVTVAGVVTHRQRPATAAGITFLNLEDETGHVNVVCSVQIWDRHRRIVRSAAALVIGGRLERGEGVTNVIAETIELLHLGETGRLRSRDFH